LKVATVSQLIYKRLRIISNFQQTREMMMASLPPASVWNMGREFL
jgi:hypothetical protein